MAVVLPSTVAAGVLKDHEKAQQTWKPVYCWPYPVMSKGSRLSYSGIPHRLQLCCSNSRRGAREDFGRNQLKKPLSSSRNHGCPLIPGLYKNILFGFMKSRHERCLYPPVVPRFVLQREASVLTPESGEDIEIEDSDDSDAEVDQGNVVQETLTMFEWPEICAQVAQYACTPMGIAIAEAGNLTIGANKTQSEVLLDQTADALALSEPLNFSGIEDIQGLLAEAMSGSVCEINELCSIKNTLTGIQSVHDQLRDPTGTKSNLSKQSSLQALMFDSDLCSDLVSQINYCLDCTRGTVLDMASPGLAAARQSRQENMRALEVLLKETATWVVHQGGMDSVVVTRRRSRLCIAVRSSHKSLLPGGIVLDVSNTGTTSFMEPEAALKLNNEETRLAAAERGEEIAVLKSLTLQLVDKADSIMDLLGRITVLDLACARASHARWLGSVCPSFNDKMEFQSSSMGNEQDLSSHSSETSAGGITQAEDYNALLLDMEGMRHPLLLGSVVPILPVSQRYGIVQSSTSPQIARSEPKVANSSDLSETLKLPVPIDIKVRAKVRVVTITGPNTGGKTATLKACGVAAIMAKAGLFLPAVGQPKLPWFDMVLADIGDSQSLEQSLSTFSGHVRRISSILELCTDQSFILLDEIGGGTDPSEGAALATAVLRYLSSEVWLTIATTHSAELKTLDQDPRFENASVEFDVVTLKPTYRVLWGVAGQSNALDIAASLGFDHEILTRARELVGKLRPSQLGARTAEVLVPLIKQRDEMLERSRDTAEVLSKARDLHLELKAATDDLSKREAARKKEGEGAILSDIESAKLRIDQVIERFEEAMSQEGVNNSLSSMREVHAEISSIVEEYKLKQESTTILELFSRDKGSLNEQSSGPEAFAVGEKVLVRKLGKSPVTIMELRQKGSDFLTVQLGTLKMQVKANEVVKITKSRSGSGSDSTRAKTDKVQMSYKVRRPTKSQTSEVASPEQKYQVAVQTSKNTLDLRGTRVEDAIRELNTTLASKSPLSVLFVVHGIGTGAVKEAVHQTLRQHPYVAKFEEESTTNAGCTIVYIK